MKEIILGIETSCDETAAAVYCTKDGILSNELYSQIELHAAFGGVVPEIASRSHLEKIEPIISSALAKAAISFKELNTIAVTYKPGLPGSLLVGLNFAKSLAWSSNKRFLGVNHLEGHIFSACIEHTIPFPFICISASGGHTALYYVKDYGSYTLLGQTLDDAAGEAFDKIAKLMNLPYPGGPVLEKLAETVGFQDFFHYPRPTHTLVDFSFSGLKTAVLYDLIKRDAYDIEKKQFLKNNDTVFKSQVASSLHVCMGDVFEQKLKKIFTGGFTDSSEYKDIQAVAFVGGVACNAYLKKRLANFCAQYNKTFFAPSRQYCTDNGAMIAFVASYKAQQGLISPWNLDIYDH